MKVSGRSLRAERLETMPRALTARIAGEQVNEAEDNDRADSVRMAFEPGIVVLQPQSRSYR